MNTNCLKTLVQLLIRLTVDDVSKQPVKYGGVKFIIQTANKE